MMNQKIKFLLADFIVPVEGKIQSPGVLRIEGDRISHVGSLEILDLKKPGDAFYELKKTVLFPGFVNAHCHLELTALGPVPCRGGPMCPPSDPGLTHVSAPTTDSFVNWIANIIQAKSNLPEEKMTSGMVMGIQKMLLSGVTTIGDHMSFNAPWEALVSSPLRGRIFGEVIGVVKEVACDIYSTLKEIKKNVESRSALFKMSLSPHSVHALHPDLLREVLQNEDGPFSCHIAESEAEKKYFLDKESELQQFISKKGVGKLHEASSGLDFLASINFQMDRLFLIHANYLSQSDLGLIEKYKIGLVHCPGSHRYFAHNDFPLKKYLDRGFKVALGTDSIASNTDLDFLKEIRMIHENNEDISLNQLLELATLNGARVLKMEEEIGSLVTGKKADLVGLSLQSEDPLQALLEGEVNFLVINGDIVLETKNLS